jgi:hypothetical protein
VCCYPVLGQIGPSKSGKRRSQSWIGVSNTSCPSTRTLSSGPPFLEIPHQWVGRQRLMQMWSVRSCGLRGRLRLGK